MSVFVCVWLGGCVCMSVCKNLNFFYTENKIPHNALYNDHSK